MEAKKTAKLHSINVSWQFFT